MTQPRIELLVLDAQGVVLNKPLIEFLVELASRTNRSPEALIEHWRTQVRLPAWTGAITDDAIWDALSVNGEAGFDPHALLESRYQTGPAAQHLARWSHDVPIWLLSNHRSHWLTPRLKRFDLHRYFERILVSDTLGVAKPDPRAFDPILAVVENPASVLFVDDLDRNLRAAQALGISTVLADDRCDWVQQVDRHLAR